MATSLQAQLNKLSLDRERARVRATELRRQRLVLENELASPGIFPSEREYLQQRIQKISNDEDLLGPQLARLEREIAQIQLQEKSQRQTIVRRPVQQTVISTTGLAVSPEQVRRFQQSVRLSSRARTQREETYERLKGQAKKTAIAIIVIALVIAVVADIASLWDLGWVVSWLIPIVTWFMARRIRAINRSVENIVAAQQSALGTLRVLRQRLRPALIASGQSKLFASAETLEIRHKVSNYFWTFIRDEVAAQLLELIPVVDWLPMYLASVAKVIWDQRQAYQKAKAALVPYRQTLDLLARLEDFEVQYTAAQLGIAAPAPQRPLPQVTRPAPSPRLELQPA